MGYTILTLICTYMKTGEDNYKVSAFNLFSHTETGSSGALVYTEEVTDDIRPVKKHYLTLSLTATAKYKVVSGNLRMYRGNLF